MREFPIELKLLGLSPGVGEPGAEFLVGLRPHKDGYEGLLAPRLITALAGTWPFPQLLKLNDYNIVATADTLYSIEGDVLLSGISSAGYPWSGAIVGDYIILTNNKVVVAGRGYTLEVDTTALVPVGRCICSIGGQYIIGAPWMYGEQHPKAVAWSRVGVADFTIEEGNVAGLRFAEVGDVLAVKPQVFTTMTGLQRGFFAFGTAGVASFIFEGHPIVYKQKLLTEVGIYSQLAAAGTDERVFYIGTDRRLYVISDRKVKGIGFEKEFRIIGSDAVLSYDHEKDELWAGF